MFPPLTYWLRQKHFRQAMQRQKKWLEPDFREVCDFQLNRLQAVWRDAVSNVPYYQKLVEEETAPHDFSSLSEFFEKVPILTRDEIIAQPRLFRRKDRQPDGEAMTAGSTGNPLHFGFFKEESEFPATNLLVGRIANGMKISDRIFLLWGHSHLLGTGWTGWIRHALRKVKDWAKGYRRADAYHLDPERARAHFRAMLDFKPQILIGYAASLDLLVRFNEDKKLEARNLRLKFVVSTSEVLPRPDTQDLIQDFFNCPLVMEYGGVEFGAVAHNRPRQPYRVYWWDCLTEVSHNSGTDHIDSKALIVTPLYPRYLPLVRYCTGDEVRGGVMLDDGSLIEFSEVCGRHNDAVQLNDGSIVHSVGLFHCIHQEKDVYNIQLVIEPEDLKILLVASSPNPEMADRIRRRLKDLNPALESCEIKFAPDLITNRAGKRRWIVDERIERTVQSFL